MIQISILCEDFRERRFEQRSKPIKDLFVLARKEFLSKSSSAEEKRPLSVKFESQEFKTSSNEMSFFLAATQNNAFSMVRYREKQEG
jgi:hypothetical protein